MASITILGRTTIDPGETKSPNITLPAGTKRCEVRINSTTAEFDDPAFIMTVVAEISEDGGITFSHFRTTEFKGQGRVRDGSFPFRELTFPDPLPVDTVFRFTTTINKRKLVGLDGTTFTS